MHLDSIKRLTAVILMVSTMMSCHTIFVRHDMKKMYGREVSFPTDMQCIRGIDSVGADMVSFENDGFRYVRYVDSLVCSPCKISHFPDYYKFAKSYGDTLRVIFVIAPGRADSFTLPNLIRSKKFPFDVFIDSGHQFEELNPFIPESENLHSFLLDEDGKICVIGNPVLIPGLKKLYENRIRHIDQSDTDF